MAQEGAEEARTTKCCKYTHILEMHQLVGSPIFPHDNGTSPSRFHTSSAVSIEDFQCPVCFNILDCPALLCANCLVTCVEDNPMQCPCCKGDHNISPDSLQAPPDVVMKMLESLMVECEKPGCCCIVPLEHLAKHIRQNRTHTIPFQRDATISDMLSQGPHTTNTFTETSCFQDRAEDVVGIT